MLENNDKRESWFKLLAENNLLCKLSTSFVTRLDRIHKYIFSLNYMLKNIPTGLKGAFWRTSAYECVQWIFTFYFLLFILVTSFNDEDNLSLEMHRWKTIFFKGNILWYEELFCLSEHSLISNKKQEVGVNYYYYFFNVCMYLFKIS